MLASEFFDGGVHFRRLRAFFNTYKTVVCYIRYFWQIYGFTSLRVLNGFLVKVGGLGGTKGSS